MPEPAAPKMSFLYRICNDVKEMRKFYSDITGLKEHTFKNDEQAKCINPQTVFCITESRREQWQVITFFKFPVADSKRLSSLEILTVGETHRNPFFVIFTKDVLYQGFQPC
ncbi:MAG: hypothetical protein KAR40_08705 [Candidatus Sabulitectum sp.]|nr:hypothetical protein [Candidatus Sabulitectum sp.]